MLPANLTLVPAVDSAFPFISMGEGVRDTYGVDYFTAGPQFTADVILTAPLSIDLGLPAGSGIDSSIMFSGKITSNLANNFITYNGWGEGTGLWITSNNNFALGMTVKIVDNSGGAGSSTGYTMHLADTGRVDLANIVLQSARCSLGLQDNSAAVNQYVNHVDVYSGNIFADRSYQAGDIQDAKINVIQYIKNGLTVYDSAVFGSWPLYGTFGRTNNGYGTQLSKLNWASTMGLNKVTIRVENGNLTENRGGSRYVSGANRLQEAHNYTYVDLAIENAGVNFVEKDGPGVLAITQVQGLGGIVGTWNITSLLAMEGVLRLGTPATPQIVMPPIDVRPDAAIGVGWNTMVDLTGFWGLGITPFNVTLGGGGVGTNGQFGAVDIDMWGHGPVPKKIIDTNVLNPAGALVYLRVGSSMGGDASFDPQPLAAKHASTMAMIIPSRNQLQTYYLGGGGGTLEIDSTLFNYNQFATTVEMGTTGTLLPGRIALNPLAAGGNTFTGPTNIYAGTLQLMAQKSVNLTPLVNLGTYDTAILNGLYANPQAGYTWTGPGQLLLDAGRNGAVKDCDLLWYTAMGGGPLMPALALNGGLIGWTSDVLLPFVPGNYGATVMSNLNPLVLAKVNVLGLGGEYSAGTMTVTFPIADAPNFPVLLYKAGKNSKLDLTPLIGGNTYTGGTIIAGGEIIVNDTSQLNAHQLNVKGGPILILNGGRLHFTAGGANTIFCVPIMVNTSGTPNPLVNCGSVIDVDVGVTATLSKNFDFSWAPTSYLEKDGAGRLDYTAPAAAGGIANAWGLKLTAGLVKVNQLPVNPANDSGPVIFNNGNLQVSQVPVGMVLDNDRAYGFRNIVALKGTGDGVATPQNTVTVEDNAMFRTHGIVPNEILGTVHFKAIDADSDPSNNVVDLSRNMAPATANPGDFSHGNGTMTFQGVTVYMSGGGPMPSGPGMVSGPLNVLPNEAGFTLELDDGVVFNASRQNYIYGAVKFNNTNPANPIRIDGEEANPAMAFRPPYYQFFLVPETWGIYGTGLTAWTGTTEKIGAGTVVISRSKGAPITVNGATALLKISGGTFEASGSADPFTDNTLTPGLSMSIVNDSTATGLLISNGVKTVNAITGVGDTTVSGPAGTELIATSIAQNTLTLGAGCTVMIEAIPGGPSASSASLTSVPEPATWILLALAAAGLSIWRTRTRPYKSGS
jgi:hypothetical protein